MLLFDPFFLAFLLPGLVLSLWASYRVRSSFRKYQNVRTSRGVTGAEVARELLRARGAGDVTIETSRGWLSDHYDPTRKILRLSRDVHDSRSVAAAGVAAHEAGHAIQDADDYAPMRFRSAIVGPASIGSNLGVFLATLPVEFDASRRALSALRQQGLLSAEELDGASTVLRAAGMTYLASAATAILQLSYFLLAAGEE